MKTLGRKISKLLVPSLFALTILGSLLFAAAPSDAGARVRVVVKPRPAARVVVKPRPAAPVVVVKPHVQKCAWRAGHWKRVSPRRVAWIPGHCTCR